MVASPNILAPICEPQHLRILVEAPKFIAKHYHGSVGLHWLASPQNSMHLPPRAQYPLRHHIDRIVHAQLRILLDKRRKNVFQATGTETIDVPMLAASVSCSVENGLGDHGPLHCT